ncbi:hypothetical protein P4S72_24245 [Vibrio sp. PP-XX7]
MVPNFWGVDKLKKHEGGLLRFHEDDLKMWIHIFYGGWAGIGVFAAGDEGRLVDTSALTYIK